VVPRLPIPSSLMPGDGRSLVEIAVVPSDELAARRRLLGALERAYPVRFTAFEDAKSPAAVVGFGVAPPAHGGAPTLRLTGAGQDGNAAGVVEFSGDPLVPGPFRDRRLVEEGTEIAPFAPEDGTVVLARIGGHVVWAARQGENLEFRAAAAPPELAEGERLRDFLRPGRFFGLLPLAHFLQVVTEAVPSELRACFVIDDPNLHALRYGYISYPSLAEHAEAHGYHVAMAMIPLDGWFASGKAVSLFRERQGQLSLLVHGNDHVRGELARAGSEAESTAIAAQALRRVDSFERRYGARVSRVMVPPHSACSVLGARGMLRAGFAALCTSPTPRAAESDMTVADWHPTEFVAGGLPNIARDHLRAPHDDLPFRAFLGQPLVLYLHHEDLRDGLEVLAEAAGAVAACGAVRWSSVGDLAETRLTMRVVGDTGFVRLFSRGARLTVPEGVRRLSVELPGHDDWQSELLELRAIGDDTELEVAFEDGCAAVELPEARDVRLALRRDEVLSASAESRGLRPWALLRRLLTEGRDRLAPALP
jgi:hypothetical protein